MEIHAAAALARIVQRFTQGREVRDAPRQSVESGSGACGSEVGYDRVVPVEQAFTLVIKSRPKARQKCLLGCRPACDGVRVWHNLGQCSAKGLRDHASL